MFSTENVSTHLISSPTGISTKKNVAINASKDFMGGHLWGNSSIPFGGTLPSRGVHGKSLTTSFTVNFLVISAKSHCSFLFIIYVFIFTVLNIRYKYYPWWIHAVILQKRPWFCWSQRASGSFSGNSIK